MLRSRLRWRALAVLGALLTVMIEWQIGLAMPATKTTSPSPPPSQQSIILLTDPACVNVDSDRRNCSGSSFSVTSGVNVIDSQLSGNPSVSVSSGRRIKQQIVSTSSADDLSTSAMHKSSSVHSKRKRKKNVFRVTAATLRSLRTHSNDPDNGDSVPDVTTMDPVIENATIYHFLSRTDRSVHRGNNQRQRRPNNNLDRNERSANLSHISGPARKIQLYIKNRFIQLMPDGTINGTQDDLSDYTILQRTTVDVGQIKIQGVATCLYLCMDQCGTVYGSKAFTDDCVFNESMEQHHYNTYSSTYNSNSRRTLYLALNRHGEPRKLQIPPTRPLGKLATYTKALTETVPQERVEQLIAKTFGTNRVKHGLRQLCDAGKPLVELTAKVIRARPKCNMTANGQAAVSEKLRISSSSTNSSNGLINSSSNSSISHSHGSNLKRKKKKRRCRPDETENDNCHRGGPQALKKRPHKSKCSSVDEDCSNRRKSNKKNHQQHHQHQHQHQHQQQQQQKPNGGGGGHKKGKKHGGQHGKKVKNSGGGGRSTTSRIMQTTTSTSTTPTTSTIPTTTTTYTTQITSTEQLGNEDDLDSDDITGTSSENDEDEDISSMASIGGSQTNLVDSGEDFLYDGDFDVFNMNLWRLIGLLWIATWSLRVGRCL